MKNRVLAYQNQYPTFCEMTLLNCFAIEVIHFCINGFTHLFKHSLNHSSFEREIVSHINLTCYFSNGNTLIRVYFTIAQTIQNTHQIGVKRLLIHWCGLRYPHIYCFVFHNVLFLKVFLILLILN